MPVDPRLAAFERLCRDQALLWKLREWSWIGAAVDPLQKHAETTGLVRLIGQDAAQKIMADAFPSPEDGHD